MPSQGRAFHEQSLTQLCCPVVNVYGDLKSLTDAYSQGRSTAWLRRTSKMTSLGSNFQDTTSMFTIFSSPMFYKYCFDRWKAGRVTRDMRERERAHPETGKQIARPQILSWITSCCGLHRRRTWRIVVNNQVPKRSSSALSTQAPKNILVFQLRHSRVTPSHSTPPRVSETNQHPHPGN